MWSAHLHTSLQSWNAYPYGSVCLQKPEQQLKPPKQELPFPQHPVLSLTKLLSTASSLNRPIAEIVPPLRQIVEHIYKLVCELVPRTCQSSN
jgi:hypothetical protein